MTTDKEIKKDIRKKQETKKKVSRKKDKKLQEKIVELEAVIEDLKDKNLRLRAEYDNYRKRASRELSDVRTSAKADTLVPILNVFDHFKMAVAAAGQSDDMNVIKEGMKMINSEFAKAMEEFGLEEIDAIGEKFDPNIHEAVAQEASDEDEDIVIKQWRCGYKLGDRLLRPATVVVSTGQSGENSEIDSEEIESEENE